MARGKAAFERAGCATCHAGPNLTDGLRADVNTGAGALDVPSLLGVARSAPYLHDGSAATLEARLADPRSGHGDVASLDADARADLVAYLKTL